MDDQESRSPLDEESKEFDDGYDENLMGDEEDKKKLAQMTEKEREQELFNRSERRETLRIRFEIERKLRSKAKKREQERKQSKQVRKKRLRASEIYSSEGSSEDSDEYTPEVSNKSGGLNDTTTTGKSTSKINTRSALLITSSSESSASSASSSSSSSESEQENDGVEADNEGQYVHDDFQISLNDLRSLQLKRDKIEKWMYSRFFKETAIGLFVKISIGNHPQTKMHMYKIAQVMDIVKKDSVYPIVLGGQNKTDKQCVVRIGSVDRTYRMSFVSNRIFDEEDYIKWKDQIQIDNAEMPTRDHLTKKRRDLQRAHNYEYTDEDIAYEVNERSRFKDNPFNFAVRKTELLGEKMEAEASNDYERAGQIQAAIDELEEKARELEKSRNSSTFSGISIVNERNRIKNIEESERVLKESKSVKTEDPFTRRKCTPTIVHNKNNSGDKQNDKASLEMSTKSANEDGGVSSQRSQSNGIKANNVATPVTAVDDLFQAHANIDLELDIDI